VCACSRRFTERVRYYKLSVGIHMYLLCPRHNAASVQHDEPLLFGQPQIFSPSSKCGASALGACMQLLQNHNVFARVTLCESAVAQLINFCVHTAHTYIRVTFALAALFMW